LLKALVDKGFIFHGLHRLNGLHREEDDVVDERVIILRQDVDRLPENSLAIARIQYELGIKSTFYFRSEPQSFKPDVIEGIARMGHEIGYHYEDLVLSRQKIKVKRQKYKDKIEQMEEGRRLMAEGDDNLEPETWNMKPVFESAIESFGRNLEMLRKYADVKTICMHGSPMSKWDSRLLWKYYDYREFGVVLEPYFDINFEEMLYLTDTGRKWDGSSVSVRDKAEGGRRKAEGLKDENKRQKAKDKSKKERGKSIKEELQFTEDPFKDWVVKPVQGSLMNITEKSLEFQNRYNYRTTNDIIRAAEDGELPGKMMMTFHPQRWTDQAVPWVKELVWQNTKNVAKYFIIKIRQ